ICYPFYSTHIYQGLDIAVFGPLKCKWSQVRNDYERQTGRAVSKSNFLEVYAQVHVAVFTEEIIKSAFRKTGVSPLNRDVITEEMAPS
ncbi:hypothetical protein FISHEDRAFT_6368, partial [Fistulina hepatica ATCC 64428]